MCGLVGFNNRTHPTRQFTPPEPQKYSMRSSTTQIRPDP